MSNNNINSDLDHLSLHDCIIEDFEWNNKELVLYFEYIDVLHTHPNNPYDTAKCGEHSKLTFKNCVISKVIRYDTSKVTKRISDASDTEIVDMNF